MNRLLSPHGMIEDDDIRLWPEFPPDPAMVAEAEARWNAPAPGYVTTHTTAAPVPPVPKEHLAFIRRVVTLVGLETGNRYRLDVRELWPILSGARAPSAELAAAIGRSALRLQKELGLRADDERLVRLRQIAERLAPPSPARRGAQR